MDDNEVMLLWRRYKSDGQLEDRNQLFLYYSTWIRKISSSQFAKYSGQLIEWSDCAQNASVALINSIDRFDIGRGIPFEAFAYPRIKGAIINGVMHIQKDNKKKSSSEFVIDDINDIEVSELAEETFDLFVDSIIDIAFSKMLEMSSYRNKEMVRNPLDIYISSVEEEKIASSVAMLPDNLRYIITAHYSHYLSFAQIAREINLSRSRVSQLHKQALNKIRFFYEMN